MNEENNKKEYSQENRNLDIVRQEKNLAESKKDSHDVKKSGNIFIGTLNVITRPIKDRHEKHYKESNFHLIADIILAFIIISLVAGLMYILFFKPKTNIELNSSYLSEKIISGNLEVFELEYINREKGDISDCAISVKYPSNFILNSISPSNAYNKNTNTFNLGEMNNGANGKVKIEGQVIGEVGSQQFFSFTYNYKEKEKNKSLINSLIYNIEESAIGIKLDVPEKIYKGMKFDGKIIVENNSNFSIDNVSLEISGEEWIVLDSSESFNIEKISSKENKEINFSAINKSAEGERRFKIESYLNINKEKFRQNIIEKDILIKVPSFKVSVKALDKIIKNNVPVKYLVNYVNNEEEEISDIIISFKSLNSNYKIDSISINDNIDTLNNNIFSINKNLSPRDNSSFNILTNYKRVSLAINQEVAIVAAVSYKLDGQEVNYEIYSPKLKVLSDLKVSAKAYYYSPQGDQLGSGPLPPVVGYPTNYWVFLELDNFGNNLKNFKLTALVPEDILWMDNKSIQAGELLFGRVGGKLIWDVYDIKSKGNSKRLMFELGVVPSEIDIDKLITILKSIKYSAFDTYSEQEISGILAEISTAIPYDKLAPEKRTVEILD